MSKRRHPDAASTIESKSSEEILQLVANPDFGELARQYPAFHRAWTQTRQRQQQNHKSLSSCVTQEFTISLTRALLQAYFQLQLPYIENNHLCPPVPNRFFFVHWIHTVLLPPSPAQLRPTCGLDIGAGSTAIYSLLAARFFQSNMLTSEVDDKAIALARNNIAANQLEQKIRLLVVPPSHSQQPASPHGGPLQRALQAGNPSPGDRQQHLDFVMTNPPFYDPNERVQDDDTILTARRSGDGRSRTNMTVSEGLYPGGEIGFVTELIADSLVVTPTTMGSRCWYASMLGRKTSLVHLQKLLTHILGAGHVESTEFGPGQYTRWFLAWKLEQPQIRCPLARLPPHGKDIFEVTSDTLDGISTASEAVQEVVSRIAAFCQSNPGGWKLSATNPVPLSQQPMAVQLSIGETVVLPVSNFVDESEVDVSLIPPAVQEALEDCPYKSRFLPTEGHFWIDVHVQVKGSAAVSVQLTCYRHSRRGIKAIEKLRGGMAGEVARTNRKWRKLRQRQEETVQKNRST